MKLTEAKVLAILEHRPFTVNARRWGEVGVRKLLKRLCDKGLARLSGQTRQGLLVYEKAVTT